MVQYESCREVAKVLRYCTIGTNNGPTSTEMVPFGGSICFCEWQPPTTTPLGYPPGIYILHCSIGQETSGVELSYNERRSTMVTNGLYGLRSSEIEVQNKTNLIGRMVRAYWDANARAYLSAITDPETGRVAPGVERQIALMMLR
jgi:hypothetical protein